MMWNRRKNLIFTMMVAPLVSAEPVAAQQATFQEVTVDLSTTLTANGTFSGFGIQEDSNWLWIGQPNAGSPVIPDDYDNYVAPRIRAARFHIARKFIDVHWFAPDGNGYQWNSAQMQGLYRDLAELKAAGTEVMLTIWLIPDWLTSDLHVTQAAGAPAGEFPTGETNPDYADRWSTVVTDLLRHLHGKDGSGLSFDNVKLVGAPNELAGGRVTVPQLLRPYQLLRNKLDAASLQNVTLIAPDKDNNGTAKPGVQALRDTVANQGFSNILSTLDYHEYQYPPTFENDLVQSMIESVSAVRASGKPLWLTEVNDATNGANSWTQYPIIAISAANYGLNAVLPWTFMDKSYCGGVGCGDKAQVTATSETLNGGKWGMLGYKDVGYAPKTSYFAWTAITAHTVPNSTVYGNSCALRECSNLRIAVLGSPTGNKTILAYNLDTSAPKQIKVNFNQDVPREVLSRYLIDPASLPNTTYAGAVLGFDLTIALENNSFTDTIPAGAFAVYSAVNPVVNNVPEQIKLYDDNGGPTYTAGFSAATGLDVTRWVNGTSHYSNQSGATAEFSCASCRQLLWNSTATDNAGIATVYVDGTYAGKVDLYAVSRTPSRVRFGTELFASPGPHSIKVEVTGEKNPDASANYVEIDAFQEVSSGTVIDDADSRIVYSGNFLRATGLSNDWVGGTSHYSDTMGARAEYSCDSCREILFSATSAFNAGIADIYVDGALAGSVDLYSANRMKSRIRFGTGVFGINGPHKLAVVVSGKKNPSSSASYIEVDAFQELR